MSSTICSPTHFNTMEMNIINIISSSNFHHYRMVAKYFPSFVDLKNKNQIASHVSNHIDELRSLNVITYTLQYRSHFENKVDETIQTQIEILKQSKVTNNKYLTAHGLFNAINCLMYQIELNYLTDIRELTENEQNAYDFIKDLKKAIAFHIIENLPEDMTNQWSL